MVNIRIYNLMTQLYRTNHSADEKAGCSHFLHSHHMAGIKQSYSNWLLFAELEEHTEQISATGFLLTAGMWVPVGEPPAWKGCKSNARSKWFDLERWKSQLWRGNSSGSTASNMISFSGQHATGNNISL